VLPRPELTGAVFAIVNAIVDRSCLPLGGTRFGGGEPARPDS
jgi:hypothetical protein